MSEQKVIVSFDPIHTSDFFQSDEGVPRWRTKRRGYIGPRELDRGSGANNGTTRVGPSEVESRERFKKSYG